MHRQLVHELQARIADLERQLSEKHGRDSGTRAGTVATLAEAKLHSGDNARLKQDLSALEHALCTHADLRRSGVPVLVGTRRYCGLCSVLFCSVRAQRS